MKNNMSSPKKTSAGDIRKYHKLLDAYYRRFSKAGGDSHNRYGFPLQLNSSVCAADPVMSNASGIVIDNLPNDLVGQDVLDMGCGCGVISIAAAFRGASVIACDHSPKAVALTKTNIKGNPEIEGRIRTYESDLFSDVKTAQPFQKYDFILANLWFLSTEQRGDEEKDEGIACYHQYFNGFSELLKPNGVACLTSSDAANFKKTEEIMQFHDITPHITTIRKAHFDGKASMGWRLYSFDKKGAPAPLNRLTR